jgi:hypothetical protein
MNQKLFRSNENCFGVFPFNKCRWCFYSRPSRLELIQSNWGKAKERTIVYIAQKSTYMMLTGVLLTYSKSPKMLLFVCLFVYLSFYVSLFFFPKIKCKKIKNEKGVFCHIFLCFLGEKKWIKFLKFYFLKILFFPLWFNFWFGKKKKYFQF